MNNIKSLLKQYEEINTELNKQIQENGKKVIEELFQGVFDENKGLQFVMIRGSTPSFNDGEPCYHSQETFLGCKTKYGDYDFSDYSLEEDFEFEDTDEGVVHLNSSCETLDKVYSSITVYDEIIERIYDTNFELRVSLDETGKVVVDHEYYDCGY